MTNGGLADRRNDRLAGSVHAARCEGAVVSGSDAGLSRPDRRENDTLLRAAVRDAGRCRGHTVASHQSVDAAAQAPVGAWARRTDGPDAGHERSLGLLREEWRPGFDSG